MRSLRLRVMALSLLALVLTSCSSPQVKVVVINKEKPFEVGRPIIVAARMNFEPTNATYRWSTAGRDGGHFTLPASTTVETSYVPEQPGEHDITLVVVDALGAEVVTAHERVAVVAAALGPGPPTMTSPPTVGGGASLPSVPRIDPAAPTVPPPLLASVRITDEPPRHEQDGPVQTALVSGYVAGIENVNDYRVVVYSRLRDGTWIVQPQPTAFMTPIAMDFTWRCETRPGIEYAALLVRTPYRRQVRPVLEDLPPEGGDILRITRKVAVPPVLPVAPPPPAAANPVLPAPTPTSSNPASDSTASTKMQAPTLSRAVVDALTREMATHQVYLTALCGAKNRPQYFSNQMNHVSVNAYRQVRADDLPEEVKRYYTWFVHLIEGNTGTAQISGRVQWACGPASGASPQGTPVMLDVWARAAAALKRAAGGGH